MMKGALIDMQYVQAVHLQCEDSISMDTGEHRSQRNRYFTVLTRRRKTGDIYQKLNGKLCKSIDNNAAVKTLVQHWFTSGCNSWCTPGALLVHSWRTPEKTFNWCTQAGALSLVLCPGAQQSTAEKNQEVPKLAPSRCHVMNSRTLLRRLTGIKLAPSRCHVMNSRPLLRKNQQVPKLAFYVAMS